MLLLFWSQQSHKIPASNCSTDDRYFTSQHKWGRDAVEVQLQSRCTFLFSFCHSFAKPKWPLRAVQTHSGITTTAEQFPPTLHIFLCHCLRKLLYSPLKDLYNISCMEIRFASPENGLFSITESAGISLDAALVWLQTIQYGKSVVQRQWSNQRWKMFGPLHKQDSLLPHHDCIQHLMKTELRQTLWLKLPSAGMHKHPQWFL